MGSTRTIDETRPAVASGTQADRWIPSGSRVLAASIITVGAGLRLVQFLSNRSLWHDESALAANLLTRSIRELVLPLDFNQGAPIGFLSAAAGVLQVVPPGEMTLRIVPLVAGLVALPLFAGLVWSVLPSTPQRLLALVLFAVSPTLVYFSSELKQYAVDVAAVLAISVLAIRLHERTVTVTGAVTLGTVGAVSVWMSHASVFAAAAALSSLAVVAWLRRDRTALAHVLVAGTITAISFAAVYMLTLRTLAQDDYMLRYWSTAFMPLPPTSPAQLLWFVHTALNLLEDAARLPPLLGAVAIITGILTLGRERFHLAVLLLPLAFALLASGFGKYPFQGRMVLFAVPAVLLVAAAGAVELASRLRSLSAAASLAIPALLLFPSLQQITPLFLANPIYTRPGQSADIRSAMEFLAAHRQQDDIVYVHEGAATGFAAYSALLGIENIVAIPAPHSPFVRQRQAAHLDQLRDRCRVWLLFSPTEWQAIAEQERFATWYVDQLGTRVMEQRRSGSAVYLFNLCRADGRTGEATGLPARAQSARSVVTGSTRVARSAGRNVAAMVTASRVAATAT